MVLACSAAEGLGLEERLSALFLICGVFYLYYRPLMLFFIFREDRRGGGDNY